MNVVAELDGNGNVSDRYIRGINLVQSDKHGFYLFNAHGDVVETASRIYDYDAFGNEVDPASNDTNPFRYCGEMWDSEAETYYLRNRMYAPRNGIFTQEDPIRSGLNWYSYCGGNPIAFIDPNGLKYEFFDPHTREFYTISDPFEAIRHTSNPYRRLEILADHMGWTRYDSMSWEDVYWMHMSPSLDGIAHGQTLGMRAEQLIDIDFWYPLEIHQRLYREGLIGGMGLAGNIQMVAGAIAMQGFEAQRAAQEASQQFVTSNTGNAYNITPSARHSVTNTNPGLRGARNSSVDYINSRGVFATRRWFGPLGRAKRDIHMTNHGNPKLHPEYPHQHRFQYNLDGTLRNY